MSAIVVDGNLVHYETVGRGRAVLFLHGWLGSWRYWMQSMEELADGRRCYAPDFWGFGDSERVKNRYHIEQLVAQMNGFLNDLGIWRISLVGHALGAAVAVQFAYTQPDRVERLMAVSLPVTGAMVNPKELEPVIGRRPALGGYRWQDYPELVHDLPKTDPDAILMTIESLITSDMPAALAGLDMPVLLVYGRRDPIVRALDESILNPARYNTRIITFDDARHFPMLEERSKFNRLIKDFFACGDDLRTLELKQEWKRRSR